VAYAASAVTALIPASLLLAPETVAADQFQLEVALTSAIAQPNVLVTLLAVGPNKRFMEGACSAYKTPSILPADATSLVCWLPVGALSASLWPQQGSVAGTAEMPLRLPLTVPGGTVSATTDVAVAQPLRVHGRPLISQLQPAAAQNGTRITTLGQALAPLAATAPLVTLNGALCSDAVVGPSSSISGIIPPFTAPADAQMSVAG
jgi:hypothetical protein